MEVVSVLFWLSVFYKLPSFTATHVLKFLFKCCTEACFSFVIFAPAARFPHRLVGFIGLQTFSTFRLLEYLWIVNQMSNLSRHDLRSDKYLSRKSQMIQGNSRTQWVHPNSLNCIHVFLTWALSFGLSTEYSWRDARKRREERGNEEVSTSCSRLDHRWSMHSACPTCFDVMGT